MGILEAQAFFAYGGTGFTCLCRCAQAVVSGKQPLPGLGGKLWRKAVKSGKERFRRRKEMRHVCFCQEHSLHCGMCHFHASSHTCTHLWLHCLQCHGLPVMNPIYQLWGMPCPTPDLGLEGALLGEDHVLHVSPFTLEPHSTTLSPYVIVALLPFICLFSEYFLIAPHVPGAVLGFGEVAVNQRT